jgi:hypothetical protein
MKFRVIHKSLQDFRNLWYSSWDGHDGRAIDIPNFCPTLPIDMLLSAVSVSVVVLPSLEVQKGLMNYPVFWLAADIITC